MRTSTGRLLGAFLLRDFRLAASHRLGFVMGLLGGLLSLTVLHFLSKTVGESALLRSRYGADYFTFALVGVAGSLVLRSVTTGLSARLREAQTDGSLEPLFTAPLSTVRLLSLMSAYPVLSAAVRVAVMLAAGAWLFGAKLEIAPGRLVGALGLTFLSFAALGLLSAAVVLVFKRGDPFAFLLDTATYLFSGVMYPVEVLPRPLQWVAQLLPGTHALRCLRASTLGDEAAWGFGSGMGALALWCAVSWPLASVALVWARRHVERTGTLGHP